MLQNLQKPSYIAKAKRQSIRDLKNKLALIKSDSMYASANLRFKNEFWRNANFKPREFVDKLYEVLERLENLSHQEVFHNIPENYLIQERNSLKRLEKEIAHQIIGTKNRLNYYEKSYGMSSSQTKNQENNQLLVNC